MELYLLPFSNNIKKIKIIPKNLIFEYISNYHPSEYINIKFKDIIMQLKKYSIHFFNNDDSKYAIRTINIDSNKIKFALFTFNNVDLDKEISRYKTCIKFYIQVSTCI